MNFSEWWFKGGQEFVAEGNYFEHDKLRIAMLAWKASGGELERDLGWVITDEE